MSKQTSILLTDDTIEVIEDYMQKHSCSRNKAINDLIVESGHTAQVLKYLKAIYNKVK